MSETGDVLLAQLQSEQRGGNGTSGAAAGAMVKAMTGNEAVAFAVQQIEYDTMAAFPITPSTELTHGIARAVADGKIKTDFVAVESEHSAISAIQAAAATGARVFTATSSAGLALMHEILHYYSGSRLPGVVAVVNRSVGAPLNILCDHSTIMAQRDTGWLQVFAATAQEAYHFHLLAPRWSEACDLPVMVNIDGFELSHITERLEVLPDETVKAFVGTWEPKYALATDEDVVVAYPGIAGSDYYPEIKEGQMASMRNAGRLYEDLSAELAALTGVKLNQIEEYYLDEAEVVLVVLGSASGTIRDKIRDMRARGVKAGLLIIKVFRPFPSMKVRAALQGKAAVGVMERAPVLGPRVGPLTAEIKQSLYDLPDAQRPKVVNFIFGLGGRLVQMDTLGKALNILEVVRAQPFDVAQRTVYHLDVRDEREDALLTPEQVRAEYYQPVEERSVDIRLFARGGEGIKTASKILASAVVETGGKHAQGFSVYGAERSGAPTQGFVRIGSDVINERSPILFSDIDVFVNAGLFSKDAIRGLHEDGIILINSPRPPGELRREFGIEGRKMYSVDAYHIAQDEIGDGRRAGIAMLAALMAIRPDILDIHDLLEDVEKLPFSHSVIEANKRAAARAYHEWRGENGKAPTRHGARQKSGGAV